MNEPAAVFNDVEEARISSQPRNQLHGLTPTISAPGEEIHIPILARAIGSVLVSRDYWRNRCLLSCG